MKNLSDEEIEGTLLPCPFCGNKPSMATVTLKEGATVVMDGEEHPIPPGKRFMISCAFCGAHNAGMLAIGYKTEKEALERWNTRVPAVVVPVVRSEYDAASIEALRRLATIGLRTKSYQTDSEFSWVVDEALELLRAAK